MGVVRVIRTVVAIANGEEPFNVVGELREVVEACEDVDELLEVDVVDDTVGTVVVEVETPVSGSWDVIGKVLFAVMLDGG